MLGTVILLEIHLASLLLKEERSNFLNGLSTGKSGNGSGAVVIMSQGEGYNVQRLFYTYFIG